MFNWFKREPRYPASCIMNMPAAVFPQLQDTSKPVVLPYCAEHIQRTYDALVLLDNHSNEVTLKFTINKILEGFTEDDYVALLTMLENPKLVQLVLWRYGIFVKHS